MLFVYKVFEDLLSSESLCRSSFFFLQVFLKQLFLTLQLFSQNWDRIRRSDQPDGTKKGCLALKKAVSSIFGAKN
jgi:hypothetical protein